MRKIEEFINKIFLETKDKYDVLKQIPNNSVDCIVTDPPYGYSYMGKDWDKAIPPIEAWKECLRVLKAGGFMFVMSAPRQDCLSQMIVRLGQAGFETGFTSIYWTYASGFPKATNISKAVDKRLGIKREVIKETPSGGFKRMMITNKEQEFRPKDYYPEGNKFTSNESISEEAKALDGSYGGFQPKPAVEIIIVCMKLLSEKTYVDQALKNGKGVTWIDNCRIPYVSQKDKEQATPQGKCTSGTNERIGAKPSVENTERQPFDRPELNGRFPANLLVSDDVLNDGKERKGGGIGGRHKKVGRRIGAGDTEYGFQSLKNPPDIPIDSGSFSRYFDLDKWWEKKVEELPEEVKKVFPFLICPKTSKSERNKGLERGKNIHPTVKPIKLMSYLITLGSREDDIVLDPYVGSGSTCLAAQVLNRKWIGIDCYKEYLEIASARLNRAEIVEWNENKPIEPIKDEWSEQYIKDMQEQQPQTIIETKKEKIIDKDACPKCGTKMYKGKNGYYCPKVNCDGKIEK